MPPNYHLERDPLWCGLSLYNFRTAAHEGAMYTANASNFILAAAHLYNSLRRTGILPCEWPDMERIITMHRPKNLFVGDLPTTFTNSMKSFGLVIGLPTSILAKNPRLRASDHRVSKFRKSLGMLAPTLLRFKTGICDGEGRGAHGPGDIEAYMRQNAWEKAAGDGCFNSAIDASDASGILRSLAFLLHSEDSEMTFDHFEMRIVCCKLLHELHVALGKNLDGWSEVYRDDRGLSGIVLMLLTESAEREHVAKALGLGGQLASTHINLKVRELLENLIASGGDVASRNMSDPGAFAPSV
jgi:hypothetical protein